MSMLEMFKGNVSKSIASRMVSMFRSSADDKQVRYRSQYRTLDNGLGLSVVSFPGIKTVSLRCFVFVGSVYENRSNNGISHFLEHMLFRGNEKLGDAATMNIKMEELGGEFNAATSFDQTEYWLDIHRDYLVKGIERFCQFLQFPLFEQMEVERSIILEEIIGDYNDENQLIDLDCLTAKLLWPDHAMGMPIIGDIQTVSNIKKQDLADWHQRFYTPANMIIGITGDVDESEIVDLVNGQFANAPHKPKSERYRSIEAKPQSGHQVLLVDDKDNQFGFQWTFPVYGLTKNHRVEYELLRRILDDGNSSRLQRMIREEKGLVYDISLDNTYFNNGMAMSLQSVVGINRLDALIVALVDLINELIDKGITQKELDMAKLRYRAALECNIDTAQGVLYSSLMPLLNPSGTHLEEVLAILNGLSRDAINLALKRVLVQQLSIFVLVGPWKEKDKRMLTAKLQPWISGRNMS